MASGIRSENRPSDALLSPGFRLRLPMGDAFARILHIPLNDKFLRSGGGMDGVGREHGLYAFFMLLELTGGRGVGKLLLFLSILVMITGGMWKLSC